MDLPELFARAGIQPEAAADLMTWARARTSALLATIDAKSPLGQSLAPGLAQLVMRHGPPSESIVSAVPPPPPLNPPARTTPSEVPVPRSEKTAARSSPRATARVISRPFLGAAVEAALQGGEASGNLSPETADAPPPPPSSSQQTEADDEASIGGFTRFALNVRRQPAAASERPNEARATLAHGFALHAEREASQFTDVPAPPSFEASESGVRASLHHITGGDSERSTSLVVGIPDDEGADVPMPRGRGRSGGLSAGASGSSYRPPSGPTQENTLELNLRIEDPELSSALLAMIPANGETSTMLSAAASSALMRATPVVGEPSLQITIDEGSTFVPVAAMTDDDEDEDETVALRESEPEPPTVIATRRGGRPPPPPPKRGQTSAPQPAAAPLAAAPAPEPEPTPAKQQQQRGRGRKKIVELSTPVVRPVARPSTPEPAAPRTTREAPRPEHAPIPNYLRDDDE